MHTTAPATAPTMDIDVDLVSQGDVVRIPGERRRYRVHSVRRFALIPTRRQAIPADDRARIELDLRPMSRGGSPRRQTFRPTDRILVA